MSTSIEPKQNGHTTELLHPRVRRLNNHSQVLGSQHDEEQLASKGYRQMLESNPAR